MSFDFVEEIDFSEIKLQEVVGKGTFGTVRKGRWRDHDVAVKIIETEQEKKAFKVEVVQLSRVCHPNIVKLYGACTKSPVCLVMEYAEGGSLYNVLHCMQQVSYTVSHAISWVLQCASGVAYLHNMKPGPLIHRDLKPPNLLLIMGGTVLKICDFGTACDKHTTMTNNKGSAAWMAPEVFEGSQYSEKCDVFSWGIILWEILTRKKPFQEPGATACSIMWAIHTGKRPPLIKGCPKLLEDLMTRCWSKKPEQRPSMSEVVQVLVLISQFLKGANQPITYPKIETVAVENSQKSVEDSIRHNSNSPRQTMFSKVNGDQILTSPQYLGSYFSYTSAPPSLVSSHENLVQDPRYQKYPVSSKGDPSKRRSADFSNVDLKIPSQIGHRRSGSCGSSIPAINPVPFHSGISQTSSMIASSHEDIHSPLSITLDKSNETLDWNAHLLLELRLQPLPPAANVRESQVIFENHRKIASEYVQVQKEISLLLQRKEELQRELQEDQQKTSTYFDEFHQLKKDKEGLIQLKQNLRKQLQLIKTQQMRRQPTPARGLLNNNNNNNNLNNNYYSNNNNNDDWVMVSRSEPSV